MVAVKAHLAEGFLKAPDKRMTAFLFYGPDAGQVSERAQQLAKRIAVSEKPEGEILRIDDADLENEPDRLAIELGTIPMFGGRKIIRASHGRRINTLALKALVEGGPLAGVLIVEAGNLKPDEALRLLFEKPAHAAAIACYGDGEGDLASLIRGVLGAAKMSIAPDAQELLLSRLGADRSLSRGEIEKLVLFAHGKQRIETEDVEAIVGDATELAIDAIIAAAASGDGARAVAECRRLTDSGESAQGIILMIQRHFQRLHRVRVGLDAGKPFEDAARVLRPPLFFKQKTEFGQQTRLWSSAALAEALSEIAATAKAARLAGALEDAVAERLVMALASRVRRARQA